MTKLPQVLAVIRRGKDLDTIDELEAYSFPLIDVVSEGNDSSAGKEVEVYGLRGFVLLHTRYCRQRVAYNN